MKNVTTQCRICHNKKDNLSYVAREMLLGFGDQFEYIECGQCGCVQIKDYPEEIQKYYPPSYWNEQKTGAYRKPIRTIKRFIEIEKTKYLLKTNSSFGRTLVRIISRTSAPVFSGWDWARHFSQIGIDLQSSFLDVGCGSGDLLAFLWNRGFSHLQGVDPNIQESFDNGRWKILKGELSEISSQFDLIMMHHSFEHMNNPFGVMQDVHALLKPKGTLVIRIPIANAAWQKYGTNWVQLDAPRHFFLHTTKSLELLSAKTGFYISLVEYDSTDFQFWGSEQYEQNIPLHSQKSYSVNPKNSVFNKEKIERFKDLAESWNLEKKGDQLCIHLKKREAIRHAQ